MSVFGKEDEAQQENDGDLGVLYTRYTNPYHHNS